MGWVDGLKSILNKPASVVSGGITGLGHMIGPGDVRGAAIRKIYNNLQDASNADPTNEELKQRVASVKPYLHQQDDIGNPLTGMWKGLTGNLSPSQAMDETNSDKMEPGGAGPSIGDRITGFGVNAALDPVTWASMGSSGLGTKVLGEGSKIGKTVDAALSTEKLAKEAPKAQKIAQVARQFGQGMAMTGGDPKAALLAGLGIRGVEQKIFPLVVGKFGANAVSAGEQEAEKLLGLNTTESLIHEVPQVADDVAAAAKARLMAQIEQENPQLAHTIRQVGEYVPEPKRAPLTPEEIKRVNEASALQRQAQLDHQNGVIRPTAPPPSVMGPIAPGPEGGMPRQIPPPTPPQAAPMPAPVESRLPINQSPPVGPSGPIASDPYAKTIGAPPQAAQGAQAPPQRPFEPLYKPPTPTAPVPMPEASLAPQDLRASYMPPGPQLPNDAGLGQFGPTRADMPAPPMQQAPQLGQAPNLGAPPANVPPTQSSIQQLAAPLPAAQAAGRGTALNQIGNTNFGNDVPPDVVNQLVRSVAGGNNPANLGRGLDIDPQMAKRITEILQGEGNTKALNILSKTMNPVLGPTRADLPTSIASAATPTGVNSGPVRAPRAKAPPRPNYAKTRADASIEDQILKVLRGE